MVHTPRSSFNCELAATKLMLGFFKVLGLAPFGVQKSSGSKLSKSGTWQGSGRIKFVSSRLGCFYNLSLIALQFRMLFVSTPLANDVDYPFKTRLTSAIEGAESVFGNAVLFAIWLIFAFRQNTAVKLLNRLLSFDVATFHRDGDYFSESSRCFIVLLFFTNTFVWTGLLFTEQLAYHAWVLTWFCVIVPSFVHTWFVIQYVFAVKLIEKRFRALNRALLVNSLASPVGFENRLFLTRNVLIDDLYGPKINIIRRAHTNLYEIATEISNFYSLPILLTVAFASYTAVYVAYYLVVPFVIAVEEQSCLMIVNSILTLMSVLLPIAMLASGVTNVVKETKSTTDAIRRLLTCSTTSQRDISEVPAWRTSIKSAQDFCKIIVDIFQLKQFAIELLHRKIEFTACGLFPLDRTLVHSIFSMVTSYLIILIQFQMGSYKNTSDRKNGSILSGACTTETGVLQTV